jgi:hypothetical protein
LIPHKGAPSSQKEYWNFSQARTAALGAWPAADPAKFRPAGGHGRPGAGGGRPGGLLGPILGFGWGQRDLRRVRSVERGSDRRGRPCSRKTVSPAGQYMGREAGVKVHGGGCALKLAGGGSRPGVPMEAAKAARWMAKCTRGGAASRLYRRRGGKGSHAFVAKGPRTLVRAYGVLASACAPVVGWHRADRRADDSVIRTTSKSATRGRGVSRGCGAQTRGHRPASASGYGGAAAATRGGALERGARWRVRCRAFQHELLRCRLLRPRFTPKI